MFIYMFIYIYIMYMWQMSSVFSHESAQRNDAGHLIDKNVFKTTQSFCYQWFRVSTLQANATQRRLKVTIARHLQRTQYPESGRGDYPKVNTACVSK